MAKTMSFTEQRQAAQSELDSISRRLTKANEDLQVELLLAAEGSPGPGVKRKISGMQAVLAEFVAARRETEQRILEIDEQEAAERSKVEYDKVEAFRKKAGPELKRLDRAIFEVRNATQAFFDLAENEKFQTLSLDHFLWRHEPGNGLEGMQGRFAKLQILNGAVALITDDLQHSRRGPQYSEEK